MHWLILALAIVLGGLINMCNKKDNKVLKGISFIVPFALGVLFWIMLYNSGYQLTHYSTIVRGLESDQELSRFFMILFTSCMIAGVSWGFGEFLKSIIETKNK